MDGNQCLANVRLVKCVLGGGGAYITTVNTVCDISSYHCRCMLSKYLHPQNLKKGFQSQYLLHPILIIISEKNRNTCMCFAGYP